MAHRRLPNPITYGPPSVTAIGSGVLSVWREWTLAQPELVEWANAHLPVTAILLLSIGLMAGFVIQDAANRGSWLWENWRIWTAVAEVEAHPVERHQYTNEPQHRIEWYVLLRFKRRIKNGRMLLRVENIAGKTPYVLDGSLNVERDARIRCRLLVVPIRYVGWQEWFGGWAPDGPDGPKGGGELSPPGAVVTLEIESGLLTQRRRFHVAKVDYRDGKQSDGLYVVDEAEDIWDAARRPV